MTDSMSNPSPSRRVTRSYRYSAWLLMLGVLFLAGTASRVSARPCAESGTALFSDDGGRITLDVASTPQERERGLMLRTSLPDNQGMLFAFGGPATIGFWMHDSLVPLSIAWLTVDYTVIDVQAMQPLSDEIHSSPRPFWFAVEVKQGWFAAHRVRPGDRVTLCIGNR